MSNIKERLLGAITVMTEPEALKLWNIIEQLYSDRWATVEEVPRDEIDLQMLQEAQNDPDCHSFLSAEDSNMLFQA